MTGYGEARHQSDGLNVSIELRAVNNRYLKISLRAADPYHLLEPEFEKAVRRHVRRGTLLIHLRCERQALAQDYRINVVALRSYLGQLRDACEKLNLPGGGEMLLSQVLTLPGVVPEPGGGSHQLEEEWPILGKVLDEALN